MSKDYWEMHYSIGRPINNTQIYILDRYLQLLPIGIIGEIYIGGDGLARGYLNRPKLTAEKFIDRPFGEGRLYKTGDLARYLPDGNIELIGRIDNQIKIRGYRIELAEIEANLLEHPNIEETLVTIIENGQEKQIAAYIIPTQEKLPHLEDIKFFLQQKLPKYMIPSCYVLLEAFPLTPNGKIDKKALPLPERKHRLVKEYILPQTDTEKRLARIWQQVLWIEEEIGINDNFFDLGGHSLLSVQLVARIECEFGKQLSLKALFQLSTIAELAAIIDREAVSKRSPQPAEIVSSEEALDSQIYHQLFAYTSGWKGKRVNPNSLVFGHNLNGSKPPLFWILQGYRELSQLAKYLGEEQPIYGMRSGHLIMKYTPENTQRLAKYYAREIISIRLQEPYLIGGNCQSSHIATEIAKQLQKQGKKVAILFILDNFKYQPYPEKIALMWGRDSQYANPYRQYHNPELGWQKLYPAGFSITTISGGHGEYFDEPHIQNFTQKLNSLLAEIDCKPEYNSQPLFFSKDKYILASEAYRAEINAPQSLELQVEETRLISLKINNNSSIAWSKTKNSGIRIGNHWLDREGQIVQWLDGKANLDRDLPPSSNIAIELTVTAPARVGEYLLEIDLVEEGITWFKNRGSNTAIVSVLVEQEKQAKTNNLDDLDKFVAWGNRDFEKGDFAAATKYYQKAIEIDDKQIEKIGFNLGKSLTKTDNKKQAIACFERVLLIEPDNSKIYYELANIYEHQEQLNSALKNYQKALSLNHIFPWIVHEKIGQILTKQKAIIPAIKAYQQAIKSQPSYVNIYPQLAHLLSQQKNFSEAISLYQTAIELAPDNLGLHLGLANTLRQTGKLELAIESVRYVLQINPNNAQAYLHLGNIERDRGKTEKAREYYQQSLSLDESQSGIYFYLIKIFNENNQFKEAEEIAIRGLENSDRDRHARLYFLLGNIKRKVKALDEACINYQKALELEPQHLWANKNLGDVCRDLGNLELAEQYLNRALELEKNNPYIYVSLANLKQKQAESQGDTRDLDMAIIYYQQAINLGILDFQIYKKLVNLLENRGRTKDAIVTYQQALNLELDRQQLQIIIAYLEEKFDYLTEKLID